MSGAGGPAAGRPIGVFGGSFDPVHVGHLRTAFELLTGLGLAEIRFVPSGQPPHRGAPVAPGALRLRLLKAAIAGQPGFVADDRELRRPGPSWTVETLESLRAGFAGRALVLVLGADAFLGLPTWHRWEELPGLAHIVVAHRPGWVLPTSGPVAELMAARRARTPAELATTPAGRILIREVTQLEVASSAIRRLVAAGGDPRYLVPDAVRRLILESGCYLAGAAGRSSAKEAR